MRMRGLRRAGALALLMVSGLAADADAQLDQLQFLKRTQPNVLLMVETANRMQRDANDDYYDPFIYSRSGLSWEPTIGVSAAMANPYYRRKYVNLTHIDPNENSGDRFRANTIVTVGSLQSGYTTFEARTRLAIAREALKQAIALNTTSVRFGLLKTRQSNPRIGSQGNEGPVYDSDGAQRSPTDLSEGKWKITRPEVDTTNAAAAASTAIVVKADASASNSSITTILGKTVRDAGALVPGGRDGRYATDAPIDYMLDDAKTEAQRLITADTDCRNTIVVLVVGGPQGNTSSGDLASKASAFLNISGRRVPIYVIAVAPVLTDAQRATLQAIATNSGGVYTEITSTNINAVSAGTVVPEVVRAVNAAVQNAFALPTDVNASVTYPKGKPSQFQVTSPVVGSVNLANAKDITGTALANSVIYRPDGTTLIPQRSNVLITTEFELPGFTGRLRAFRAYKPVADSSKPSGYRFDKDGTKLWVSSTPASASRNIYTALPDGSVVAFTTANAAALAPYLGGVSDAASLITWIRAQPIGAFVGSTPAFLDPPSLDPPPDADYPAFAAANANRRALIFAGANDGMMHAIDGRTGVEVWAFIPFNLLPKLQALEQGQSFDAFRYFVDSSAKIADVKIGAAWRTYLMFGQGPGGTFYQTMDVTLDGMAATVSPTDDITANVVAYFADASRIPFKWSFPRYSSFDYAPATPYTSMPYGDLKSTATAAEKTIGETWSDPAVGQVETSAGPYVVLTGSGFLKYSVQQQSNRGGRVAGTTFYILDAATGNVLDSKDVGSDGVAETVDDCRTNGASGDCTKLKNALQADPVATGPADQRFITKSYIGDLDGSIWRFDIGLDATKTPKFKTTTATKVYAAGAAHPLFASMATVNVGGTQQYIFAGTGSEFLPTNGVSQSYKLLVVLDNGTSGTNTATISLAKTASGVGEWVTSFPAVAGDIVFFSTNAITSLGVCTGFNGALYAFTFIGGPAYDTNGDGRITVSGQGDSTKVRTATGSRASAPFIVDQHLVFAAGSNVELFGDPQDFNNGIGQAGVRVLSWREIR